MATKDLTILYYDDTDATLTNHQWRKLTNRIDDPDYDDASAISTSNLPFMYGGGSPLLTCTINDRFGVQLEAELTLNNSGARHSKDFTGSTALGKLPLANGQINQYNGLLPEFTRIIIHESDSYMTLFVGRVYVVEEKFEWPYGNVMRLLCRDNLEEIAQGTLSGSEEIQLATGSNGVGNYPTSISRQLDIIKDVIAKTSFSSATSTQEIVYTDHKIDKGHTYLQGFVANDVAEDGGKVKLGDYGNTSPLKLIQNLANLEKYRIGSVDHLGYGFCLDATRTDPYYKNYGDGVSGTGILPQDFLYFRKGYYPTTTPATYGLKVVYASADSVVENPGGGNDDRQRNMFNDFNFAGFADSSVTHIVLTHQNRKEIHTDDSNMMTEDSDGTQDKIELNDPEKDYYWGETDDRTCGVYDGKWLDETKTTFVMIYVDPLDGYDTIGDFSWKTGRPGYTGDRTLFHVRSLRQVSSLHTGGDQGAAPGVIRFKDVATKTWVGNVQFQGVDATGQNFLILSNPQEDELATVAEGAVLSESSSISPRSSCKFKYFPAQKRRAKRVIYKNLKDYSTNTYKGLREAIAHEFMGSNNKDVDRLRKGSFRIADWPHMRWTNTAASGTSGFALKPYVGNDTPSEYGMRRGASVTNITGGVKYAGYISAIDDSAKTTTIELYKELELDNTNPTAYGWSQGDTYNIYVPLRTGMSFRIDNKHALTIGDQIITSINYTWSNGHVSSEITSIGANDEVLFQERGALKTDPAPSVNTILDVEKRKIEGLAANAYEARGIMWWHSHDIGATPALVAASLRDYNSFAWSGGSIKIHSVADNATYRITPGNTDAALTAAGYTSPMEANVQYVLYLDTSDTAKNAAGRYPLHIAQVTHTDDGYMRAPTYIEMAYLTIGEDEDAGEKTIGVPGSSYYSVTIPFPNGMPNIQFMNTFSNVLGVDNQLVQANRILQPNSLTSALLKKGAGRPWTSNLSIRGTAYNAIVFDNGSGGNDATLTFGNGDTVTIADGTSTGIGNNTTTYMYLDGTSAGLTGSLAPQFTTNHAIAHGDNKLLLAVIAVGVSTQGDKPNILPFNSKQMTINGGVIAADAIIASHVQTGTLGVDRLTSAAQATIVEKTITHVGNSAPGSPRTMDIWFDTSATPTVIKVWDGDSWEVRNSNAPEGGGMTTFSNPIGTIPTTANGSGANIPNVAVARYDLWLTSDTNQLFIALHATANDDIATGKWTLKNDADAINYAETEINGGLIKTQRIKLLEGGSLNIAGAGNALETTISTAVSTGRLLADSGGINTTETTFGIDAQSSSDTGRDLTGAMTNVATDITLDIDAQGGNTAIIKGDIIIIGTEEMLVTAIVTSTTQYTVTRGWRGTTIANHSTNDSVVKYAGHFIQAGDVIRMGSEDMYVKSSNLGGTSLTVLRAWNNTPVGSHLDNTAINKYTHSMVGMSNPHIILDNAGIIGYSDAFSPEFSISSLTGKAEFADGAIILDCNGINLDNVVTGSSGANNKFIQFTKTGEAASNAAFIYRYITSSVDELHIGKVQGYGIRTIGHLLPSSNGLSNLGASGDAFGSIYAQGLYGAISDSSSNGVSTVAVSREALYNHEQTTHGGGGSGTITSGDIGYVAYYTGATTIDSKVGGGIQFVDSTNIKIYANTNLGGYALKFEETGSGTDSITISAPFSGVTSYTLTLPTTDGGANQVLKTNGSGVLDWVDQTTYTAGTGLTLSGTEFFVTGSTYAAYSHGSHSGEANQSAWSAITISADGGTQTGYSIASDTTTDTFGLIAGDGIALYGDLSADTIKISTIVDDTPVNGQTAEPISSNWAYDHQNDDDAHHSPGGSGHTHSASLDITADTVTLNAINDVSGNTVSVLTSLIPYINDYYNLGAANPEWATVFCDTLTESSDARIKTDIQDLTTSDSLVFIDSLRPRSYKRLDNHGETIDNVRYGLVAQEVEEALTGLNIDKTKLNLIHLPDTETITQVIDPDGTEAEVPNPRGLSYIELIAPLIGAIKELKARIEVLEGD